MLQVRGRVTSNQFNKRFAELAYLGFLQSKIHLIIEGSSKLECKECKEATTETEYIINTNISTLSDP